VGRAGDFQVLLETRVVGDEHVGIGMVPRAPAASLRGQHRWLERRGRGSVRRSARYLSSRRRSCTP
jgi:hypothetical protein